MERVSHLARGVFSRAGTFARFAFILLVAFGWIFSGWPQIGNFPPKVEKAYAAGATLVNVAHYNSSSSASAAVSKPTNTADGDIMFAIIVRKAGVDPNSIPGNNW